jgi:tRNA threonylcarbamoyl adenosine modification protein (Sua5/YciO/YrdC/YwlC family)
MTELVEIDAYAPDYRVLQQAVAVLRRGGLVVIPTDCVYTIAGSLNQKKAVAALQKIKGGKADFSIMVPALRDLTTYSRQIERPVFRLLNNNLPGPYTFILPANAQVGNLFNSNRKGIGLRIPDHIIPQQLMDMLGDALVCTSVNDDDAILQYTTDPSQIAINLDGKVDMVLDAGFGSNEPTTVVDCTGPEPVLLREGAGNIAQHE